MKLNKKIVLNFVKKNIVCYKILATISSGMFLQKANERKIDKIIIFPVVKKQNKRKLQCVSQVT